MGRINVECGQGQYYTTCCELLRETFDGTGAAVGNDWTEDPAGGWSRDNGELVAGTGAIFCYHALDDGPPDHEIECDIKFTANGQLGAIAARLNSNLGCWLSLEVEVDAEGCAEVRLKNNKTCDGGADDILAMAATEIELDVWHHLKLCYRPFGEQDEAQVYGELQLDGGERVRLASTTTLPDADPNDYNNAGVYVEQTTDSDPIRFDNFVVEANESDLYECCPYCYYGKPYTCVLMTDDFDRNCGDQVITTDWHYPATINSGIGGSTSWTNQNNAKLDDGSNATTTHTFSFTQSPYLQATDYSFSLPSDATNIEPEVAFADASATGAITLDDVQLYKGAPNTIGNLKGAPDGFANIVGFFNTTPASTSFGGAGDTWNGYAPTLTHTDVNASDFGWTFQSLSPSGGAGRVVSIDAMPMRLNYQSESESTGCPNLGCKWENCENATIEAELIGFLVDGQAVFTLQDTYCAANYMSDIPAWAVQFLAKGNDDLDEIRGIVAIEDDDNFLYGQLTVRDSVADCGSLELYQRSGGVDTQLGETVWLTSAVTGDWHRLRVCWDGEYLGAQVTTADGEDKAYRYPAQITPGSVTKLGGIGVGAVVTEIRFNDFSLEYLHGFMPKFPDLCEDCLPDQTCIIYADAFTRDDAPTLGCAWFACDSGAIESNTAIFETSDTGCFLSLAALGTSRIVRVDVKGDDDEDELQAWVAVEDEDNFLYGQLTVGDTGCGSLKLFQRVGGVDTQLGATVALDTAYPDEWHALRVCWDGTYLWANVVTESLEVKFYRRQAQVANTPTGGGMGVGSITSKGSVDNFSFEILGNSLEDETFDDVCETCQPDSIDCIIHADSFSRPDNDDIGCLWEEVSGDHDIVTSAVETLAAGIVVSRVPNGFGDAGTYTRVGITAPSDGNSAVVIVDYLDANNYHYVLVRWGVTGAGGTTDGDFQLFRREGGVNTSLLASPVTVVGLNAGDVAQVNVCFRDGFFEAEVNHFDVLHDDHYGAAVTASVGGDRAGFGGNDVGVLFDNFSYEYIEGTEGTEDCGGCAAYIECIPCTTPPDAPTDLMVTLSENILLSPCSPDDEPYDCACDDDDDCPDWPSATFFLSPVQAITNGCSWGLSVNRLNACQSSGVATGILQTFAVQVVLEPGVGVRVTAIFRLLSGNCVQQVEWSRLIPEGDPLITEQGTINCEFDDFVIPFSRVVPQEELTNPGDPTEAVCCRLDTIPESVTISAA